MTLRYALPPLTVAAVFAAPTAPATAHEAWLLTPDEIEALAAAPVPEVFTSHVWLGLAVALGLVVTSCALAAEDRLSAVEARLADRIAPLAREAGPPFLRLALAIMLLLAAFGGLPRHGTAPWTEPTLFVPDMQLALVPGWEWLAVAQIALAAALALGLGVRIAGLAVVALSGLGLVIFGTAFLSYAPHFAAPGLMLFCLGGGALSADRHVGLETAGPDERTVDTIYRTALVLVGGGFVYLAAAYKLTQPTLLIAILEHGKVPTLGLPMPVLALAMTIVEILCGMLLAMGRLVRPVALLLIAAISVLALFLGETPLFHANLYGMMALFAMAGRHIPAPQPAAALRAVIA